MSIKVKKLVKDLNLELVAGQDGKDNTIADQNVERPGLEFAGFYDFFHFSENNLLYKPKISCFCIFSAQNSDFNTKKLASSHTV